MNQTFHSLISRLHVAVLKSVFFEIRVFTLFPQLYAFVTMPLRFKMIFLPATLFDQTCFTFKQSVGIIGGKPNNAYWFIGYNG